VTNSNTSTEDRLKEAEALIALIYRFSGLSIQKDYYLWRETQRYCDKYNVPEATDFTA